QGDGEPSGDRELFITGKMHYDLLVRTRAVLKRGVAVLEKSLSIDMLAEEIKGGISILSELSGENYSDEILDRIFNEFCIGK
ncbi:MAG: tRNA uridine-5-carboxymethylaminomethyl(34) synthesis GTPase MnmE, partial [Nitrospinota bacterium]